MTKKYLLFETTAMFLSLNLLILLQKNMHPAGQQWFSFVSQFCFGFVPIQLYGYQGRPLSHLGFSAKKPVRQLLSAFLVLAAMAAYFLIFTLIAALLGTPFEYNFAGKISDVRVLAIQFAFQVFFVGFGEEILFRGYFLDRILSISSSKKIAALITSILFGLVHFFANGSIIQFVNTTILGFILAYARLRYQNCTILSVSMAHGFYGFLLILIRFFLL